MKFFEKCKAKAAAEDKKTHQYLAEGLVKGSAHRIVDDFKKPWNILVTKREHDAAKVALAPVAAIWDLYLFLILPISLVTTPIYLGLTKLEDHLKSMDEREQEEQSENEQLNPSL